MPMISAALLAASGGDRGYAIGYFVVICVLATLAVLAAPETANSRPVAAAVAA
ncbi:MAG: hypothetical protein JO209_07990 [Acidisphaera sp.]|nr:hypothetical protein [Acidisphaera sp.]